MTNLTLDLKTLKYAFQPIFDVKINKIFGYEALMRPQGHTPLEIVKAYTEANNLRFIEEVSLYYGTKFFKEAELEGYLFINSFPNACMSPEGALKVAELGGPELASRLVIEVLEYGNLDKKVWDIKRKAIDRYGSHPLFAIDDFGLDPYGDKERIEYLNPDIIKIDRKFISGINRDISKQRTVADMIRNIKNAGIKVLAEGVETEQEYKYLLKAGVDLMQGYYLGMPQIYSVTASNTTPQLFHFPKEEPLALDS